MSELDLAILDGEFSTSCLFRRKSSDLIVQEIQKHRIYPYSKIIDSINKILENNYHE